MIPTLEEKNKCRQQTGAMSEVVERIARALAWRHFDRRAWTGACPKTERTQWLVNHYWTNFTEDASAALEAIREPTEAMIERGSQITVAADFDTTGAYRLVGTVSPDVWRAMVGEALR